MFVRGSLRVTHVILASMRGEGRLRRAGPNVVSGESSESGDECQEAIFCRQALWLSNISSENGVHFSTKLKKSIKIMM